MTAAASPPLMSRNGLALLPSFSNRYICIFGEAPTGLVVMFALSTWPASGPPSAPVAAPSSALTLTASSPLKFTPEPSVNPIGPLARWSWKLFTYQNACIAFWSALICHEVGAASTPVLGSTSPFHEHWCELSQALLAVATAAVKSVNG